MRNWMVLFPEGGFLRKRKEVSQQYAAKNNLPIMNNVSLPRVGALKAIFSVLPPHEPTTPSAQQGNNNSCKQSTNNGTVPQGNGDGKRIALIIRLNSLRVWLTDTDLNFITKNVFPFTNRYHSNTEHRNASLPRLHIGHYNCLPERKTVRHFEHRPWHAATVPDILFVSPVSHITAAQNRRGTHQMAVRTLARKGENSRRFLQKWQLFHTGGNAADCRTAGYASFCDHKFVFHHVNVCASSNVLHAGRLL